MRTSSVTMEGSRNGLALMSGERVHVGIDTHKEDYRVHVWSEQRQEAVAAWVQPPDASVLVKRLGPVKAQVARVVYEAGPTGYGLCRELRQAGFAADVIAPSRTPKSTSKAAKSDRLDARKLARYCAKGLLQPVAVPSVEEEGDRQVVRMREVTMLSSRRAKQQIKSLLLQHGLGQPRGCGGDWSGRWVAALRAMPLSAQPRVSLDLLLDELAHLRGALLVATRAVRSLAKQPRYRAHGAALQSVPGVGPITAMTFLTELIHPERFDEPREVTAMLGLAPLVYGSGQSVRQGPLMKTGNNRLRTALIEAAWRWVAKDPWAGAKFAQLQRRTASRKKGIVAMARRLGIIPWRIRLTGRPYQPKAPKLPDQHAGSQPRLPDAPAGKRKGACAKRSARPASVQTSG